MAAIEFAHELGHQVEIKALGLMGVVIACCIGDSGKTYRVVFWVDNKRQDEWLYSWELGKWQG